MKRRRNAIFRAIFVTVFLTTACLGVKKVEAAICATGTLTNCLNEWFSFSNQGGHFIEETNLKLNVVAKSGTEVQLLVTLNANNDAPPPKKDPADPRTLLGFQFNPGTEGTATPTGKIVAQSPAQGYDVLGSWSALFEYDHLEPLSDQGAWLDYAPKSNLSPACLNDSGTQNTINGYVDDECFNVTGGARISLIYMLLTRDPGSGVLPITFNEIQRDFRTSGLTPNTEYVARIRLEENGSADMASSKLISFTTDSSSTPTLVQQGVTLNNNSTTTDGATKLPSCGIFDKSDVMGCVAQIIFYVIFTPTSYIMTLAGEIMDWGLGYSIDSDSYPVSGHSFVTDGWRIMRDLANIFFIFILVYIAITTILGQTKERLIGMVILVALTINFSLFLTKIVRGATKVFHMLSLQNLIQRNFLEECQRIW
jgi:hypothetical protein